ncbi:MULTISPECIES: hypothetical protein [unclassified Bradyrhizobium]|uniref:hypothetical protein n=1 Tax=unclassified Bradyrhizobium TaxID=2631580 RepID=UPI001FF7678B|nr:MULTISPECIES: hypothetical protein [unclassified Bradyrhizobium]MCK1319647.1 hypothetical protein [Bradyrhizobium sp. 156]MCK1566651.1 hypothetical protein [Bradyrhizobium sp. 173]UPJ31152.1 hypothetical protein IVB54_01770 [Bradyrhizobium sp. CW1]UPJ99529.1 hypothetical protein IVB07_01690 [Bradyrhizobium sp. 172]
MGGFRQDAGFAGRDLQCRAVLEDVCESVSCYETAARTHVASMILEAASKGETSVDGLKQIGRSALRGAPIVWN